MVIKKAFQREARMRHPPVAHDGEVVSDAHAQVLAHLGVKGGHTAKQTRTALKKIHGLM